MNASVPFATDLRLRLNAVRRLALRTELASGTLFLASSAIAGGFAVVIAEAVGDLSAGVRTTLVVAMGGALLVVAILRVLRPALKLAGLLPSDSDETIAVRVGQFFPSVRDHLLNALQLASGSSSQNRYHSPALLEKALQELGNSFRENDFTGSVNRRPVRLGARRFAAVTIIVGALFAIFPSMLADAFSRVTHFRTEFIPPPDIAFDIQPGDREIVQGEMVVVSVHVRSTALMPRRLPAELTILRIAEGRTSADETTLQPDSVGSYHIDLPSLTVSTEYFARYAGEESRHYRLAVVDRPILRSLRVNVEPPAYTGLPPQAYDEFVGDVTAPEGSTVRLRGSASKELNGALLRFDDSASVPLRVRAARFEGSFTIRGNTGYAIDVKDRSDLHNDNPVHYRVQSVPDAPPTVRIVEPGRNIDLAGDRTLTLGLEMNDDYGFSSLRLGYRLAHSRFEPAATETTFVAIWLAPGRRTEAAASFVWNLAPLNLVPEDVVEYFADVFDNDAVHGPKGGRSRAFLLRLPSLDEVFSDARQEHEQSIDNLAKNLEEAKKLREDLDRIDRDLKMNKDPDWQTQRKVADLAEKYTQMEKAMSDVRKAVDQMSQKMQDQNVLSPETMEKYQELQQMMSELNPSELQELLKQMQGNMPAMSKEKLQEAMQKATFSEERFRQALERTLNLLKRIQIEQRVDELKKRTDEIVADQERLEKQTASDSGGTGAREERAKRQEDLAKAEKSLEQSAEELQKKMEEFFTEMPSDRLGEMNRELQKQNLSELMKQAMQAMQQGRPQESAAMQQQAREQLQQYGRQLEALQQQMLQQQAQAVFNALRKSSNDLLSISREQEALKTLSQNSPPNSPSLRENARRQQAAKEDLQQVIKDLTDLSQKSFAVTPQMGRQISEAMRRMGNAAERLGSRSGPAAALEQGMAMAALNGAAVEVRNALSALMQGGGGGGLMQQLRMMAGGQMAINLGTQRMGEGISERQAAEAGRLAREQEAVRKSLEQLEKESKTSEDRKRILGDLQKIIDEMKEVERDLEQNSVNPETTKKQDRILSRLLDASRSVQERDFEKKRRAQTGREIRRASPAEIDPSTLEGKDRMRQDLLRALQQGYARDYQELIRRYFERLEKEGMVR